MAMTFIANLQIERSDKRGSHESDQNIIIRKHDKKILCSPYCGFK